MKLLLVFVGCLALLAQSEANPLAARYDDFKVYRVNVADEQQLSEFQKLGNNLPLHFLNELRGPGFGYDVVIDPANEDKLEKQLRFLELDYKCVISNLQSVIEEAQPRYINRTQAKMSWTEYHDLPVINKWLKKLAARNRRTVKLYTIGYTYEGRSIYAIRISFKRGNKAILLESNIHAIEWISSAATSYFVDNLLNSEDEDMVYLRENFDWLYVPVLNPDGFEYSHNVNRLWRKNRSPTGFHNCSGPCYGTDLNRNFDYGWGTAGHNLDVPCDHWYAGAMGDSELEVFALERFINRFKDNYICMYLACHSYGQYVLLPFGNSTTVYPFNYDQMMSIATAFADAAKEKYGTKFSCGASGLLNYSVSGSAKDWAYGVKNIPFTATIELRDRGQYGFFLPKEFIVPVGLELTDGIIGMVRKASEELIFT